MEVSQPYLEADAASVAENRGNQMGATVTSCHLRAAAVSYSRARPLRRP